MKTGKKRRQYLACQAKNASILSRIIYLKSMHPFWGYRRIWATLKYVEQFNVNHKRVYDLMKQNNLLCRKNVHLKALRTHTKKPQPTAPNQYWGIDMTKVLTPTGWVYTTIVLDWFTKKVVGYHIGLQSKSEHWLQALDMALNRQFKYGSREQNLKLVSDNGCQPTSVKFMKTCATLDVEQIFTAYCNPKGNADTERFMRTLKEECVWLQDWKCADELMTELKSWLEKYNYSYLHSTLKYKTPMQVENAFLTLLIAA